MKLIINFATNRKRHSITRRSANAVGWMSISLLKSIRRAKKNVHKRKVIKITRTKKKNKTKYKILYMSIKPRACLLCVCRSSFTALLLLCKLNCVRNSFDYHLWIFETSSHYNASTAKTVGQCIVLNNWVLPAKCVREFLARDTTTDRHLIRDTWLLIHQC